MIASAGGDDTLTVGAGSVENRLYGDGFSMQHGSTGGDDVLMGGADATTNRLYGDARSMISSTGGDDTLEGGANSTINYLFGDADLAIGVTCGDDRLVSGTKATDHMWGDFQSQDESTGGNDTFVFGPNGGTDYIYDFHRGEDVISLSGYYKKPIQLTTFPLMRSVR